VRNTSFIRRRILRSDGLIALVRPIRGVECAGHGAVRSSAVLGGWSLMRRAGGVFVCLGVLWTASPEAKADDAGSPGGVGIGVSIGTTGVGGELSIRPIGSLVLRAGGSWFALNHNFPTDDLTFNMKANLISAGAALDWHPFANGFRLSAGGRYHNVDFSGSATGNTFTINGTVYNLATTGPISGSMKWSNPISPYLGLGYDSTHFSDSRWAIAFDFGAIYMGAPTSHVTANTLFVSEADRQDAEKKLNEAGNAYGRFWPIATIALKFRF
jgi:hypothetical protein